MRIMECQKPGGIKSKEKLAVISLQFAVGSKSKSIACTANYVVFRFFVFN